VYAPPLRVALLSTLLLLVLSGCTHTRVFNPDGQADRATVNELAANRAVTIETEDGGRFRGTGLWLDADTAFWMDQRTGEALQAPLSTIRSVKMADRTRGAAWGALIGLPLGIIGGYVYASDLGYGPDRGANVGYGALVGGFGSALLGAWLGYATRWLRLEAQHNTAVAPVLVPTP
jgi:hypothetical protein